MQMQRKVKDWKEKLFVCAPVGGEKNSKVKLIEPDVWHSEKKGKSEREKGGRGGISKFK